MNYSYEEVFTFFHIATIVFQIFSVRLFRYLIVCTIKWNNSRKINVISVEITLSNVTEIIWSFNALPPGSRWFCQIRIWCALQKGYFYNLDPDPGQGPWTRALDQDPKNLDPEKLRPWKTWETAGYGKMIRRTHIITY